MKLAPVEHRFASTIRDATQLLAQPGARVLAGGQSLLPLLARRATACSVLVDINRIGGLDELRLDDSAATIGAAVRQSDVVSDVRLAERAPLLREAGLCVAQEPVRNLGTLVGSIAHADPNSELAAACLALDAEVLVAGPAGDRSQLLHAFLVGPFATSLRPGEFVTAVRLSLPPPGTGQAFVELTRTHNSPAIAGAAVVLTAAGGIVLRAAVALCGAAATPIRSHAAEVALAGLRLDDPDALADAAAAVESDCDPVPDVHGSAAYRTRMAAVMARRAVHAAAERAREETP